jgi:hypothetical protein
LSSIPRLKTNWIPTGTNAPPTVDEQNTNDTPMADEPGYNDIPITDEPGINDTPFTYELQLSSIPRLKTNWIPTFYYLKQMNMKLIILIS